MGFNLSEWALKHRSFVVYLMLVAVVVGVMSYLRLGRNEDPAFTFRTMIVQAAWPGATLEDTLDQVTERIEQTLKETPNLDFLRSFTSAGVTTIFVTLKGSTPAKEVPDIWYRVRKSVGDIRHTLPAGIVDPVSTMSSATPSESSTASPRTVLLTASFATTSKASARGCCASPTSPRSRSSALRTNRSSSSSPPRSSRVWGSIAPP
jgi:multidrug efflux pump subunit AcrB